MKSPIPFRFMKECFKNHQAGAILPLVAMGAASLVGAMGLSLDVGNVLVARQELRAAAEAAALAGGAYLSQGTNLPNFPAAEIKARDALAVLNNQSNGELVKSVTTNGAIQSGYYDPSGAKPFPQPFTPGANLIPAVRVQLVKEGANGVVNTFFSKVFSSPIPYFNPKASATAIGNYAPASATPGQVLPLALPQSLMDNLWDPATHQPLVNKGSATTLYKNPTVASAPVTRTGEPYRVRIWDNSCNLDVPQKLPGTERRLTDSREHDDHEGEHYDDYDDYDVVGTWHTYENDAVQTCSSDDDCPIKNKTELKAASYGSDHHDLQMCSNKDTESSVRKSVVSACKGGNYAGYVAVVDRCSHSGKTGKIQAFAAVNIVGSGVEHFEKNKDGKPVDCGYVDIQLVAPGHKEAHAADEDGEHEDDGHGLTNAKEFSCQLKGKGFAEDSYVTAHPQVVEVDKF